MVFNMNKSLGFLISSHTCLDVFRLTCSQLWFSFIASPHPSQTQCEYTFVSNGSTLLLFPRSHKPVVNMHLCWVTRIHRKWVSKWDGNCFRISIRCPHKRKKKKKKKLVNPRKALCLLSLGNFDFFLFSFLLQPNSQPSSPEIYYFFFFPFFFWRGGGSCFCKLYANHSFLCFFH
jgi:hypothetical protein